MPLDLVAPPGDPIGLDDLVDAIEASGIDPAREDELVELAPLLARLGRNRRFLGDRLVAELVDHAHGQQRANPYNAQVVMLHRADRWFVRANIWPAERDAVLRVNGPGPFYYHVPHDHDFSFLTVGYWGPGYASDYHELIEEAVLGVPGEQVSLRDMGRSALHEGRLLLYRAHRDVHSQIPPSELSVSLNIVGPAARSPGGGQYRYDIGARRIHSRLDRNPVELLLPIATLVGGEEARDLADRFAARHPCDRVRMAAVEALAATEPGLDARVDRLERHARAGNPHVSAMAARRVATIAAARGWIAAPI